MDEEGCRMLQVIPDEQVFMYCHRRGLLAGFQRHPHSQIGHP